MRFIKTLLLLVVGLRALGAQRTVDRATAGGDTTQSFAIYYPAAYPGDRKWPVILVMDPRGRGRAALDLFAPAAERYGYVVLSSYNTLSDGDDRVNVTAVNAMLSGLDGIAADLSRLYIAGMSGTARVGWELGREMPEHFAGILAASAAPLLLDSVSNKLLRSPGFAFTMTAGRADFNFTEVHSADRVLRSRRVPAFVDYFAGGHGWPTAALIDRAVAWFSLRAMLGGKLPADSGWIRAQFAIDSARVDAAERQGQWLTAADGWSSIALGYAGYAGAELATRRARDLDDRKPVQAMRKRLIDLDTKFSEVNAATVAELSRIRLDARYGDPSTLARALEIDELKRQAATGDSLERPWAARVLANTQAFIGFYEPRGYLARKQPERAIMMLETAKLIAPWTAQQCALLEQAAAMMPGRAASRCGGTEKLELVVRD